MTIPYAEIIAYARDEYELDFIAVSVDFPNKGEPKFNIHLKVEAKDDMVHINNVSHNSLTDTISELVRRCEFNNGRVYDVMIDAAL